MFRVLYPICNPDRGGSVSEPGQGLPKARPLHLEIVGGDSFRRRVQVAGEGDFIGHHGGPATCGRGGRYVHAGTVHGAALHGMHNAGPLDIVKNDGGQKAANHGGAKSNEGKGCKGNLHRFTVHKKSGQEKAKGKGTGKNAGQGQNIGTVFSALAGGKLGLHSGHIEKVF